MPCVSKIVAPFKNAREGPVRIASLRGRRAVIQGSANEGMVESDLGPVHADEVGFFCTNEVRRVGTQRAAGSFDKGHGAGVIGGRDEQSPTRSLTEDKCATGERSLDSRPDTKRLLQRCAAAKLCVAQRCWKLEQRERVSTRQLDEPLNRVGIYGVFEQGGGIVTFEPGKHELLDAGPFERHLLPVTRGEDQRYRIVVQPSGCEHERITRRRVQPMGVVDQYEQHLLAGPGRQQRERRGAEGKTVDRAARPESECTPNELLLRLGQLVQTTEQRTKHIGEACEGQLELALHAGRPDNGGRPGALARVLEQRRLPDAGLATDRQSAAAGGRRLVEKTVDSRSLLPPPYEHLCIR
jgi:hypothetical protein